MKLRYRVMENNPLSQLVGELDGYRTDHLLAQIGALQLLPRNADRSLRLEFAAHVVATLRPSEKKRLLSRKKLAHILNHGVLCDPTVSMMEDPFPGLFTEAFTFIARSYLVFPGINGESVFAMRHIAKALILGRTRFPDHDFATDACQLLLAVLLLSDEIARRAGLGRAVHPESNADRQIVVPPQQELEKLRRCVVFNRREVRDLLETMNLHADVLEPLIVDAGKVALNECTPEGGRLHQHPIVRIGAKLVVAIPSMLLPATRHQILCQATKRGVIGALAARFLSATWNTVRECLGYLGNPYTGPGWENELPNEYMKDGLFALDTDKALYACLLTDDFSDYDPLQVFGSWSCKVEGAELDECFIQTMEKLARLRNPPNDILFVLLTQGIGRDFTLGLQRHKARIPYTLVTFSAAELETVAFLDNVNSLMLWKFGRASGELRKSTKVMAFGSLDEFACYRDCGYSFYLSDESPPHVLAFQVDHSTQLKLEVADKIDPHGVLSYEPNSVTDVVAVHGTRSIPVYAQRATLGMRIAILVEGYAIPIWIVGLNEETDDNQDNRPFLTMLADAIAYWLWQVTPSLMSWFDARFSGSGVFVIYLQATEKLPISGGEVDASSSDEPFTVKPDVETASVTMSLGPNIVSLMSGPDNQGERAVMEAIFGAMKEIDASCGSERLTKLNPEEVLRRHAEPPQKKKIIVIENNADPRLDRRGLPTYREVQAADANIVLDGLGPHLTSNCGYGEGPVAAAHRGQVLNSAVAYYFEALHSLVRSLSPRKLLETLVCQHEAVVRQEAFGRLMIPTRLACYESEETLHAKRLEERSELARVGLALRFVIEYVVAQPPKGIRPISLSVLDHLVALASELVETGLESDLLILDLSDYQLEILGSGRLGRGTEASSYYAGQRQFMQALAGAEIQAAPASFTRRWRKEKASPQQDIDEMKAATKAEFGYSLADVCALMETTQIIATETFPGGCRLPEQVLVERLAEGLNWPRTKLKQMIGCLSLKPRSQFWQPPGPFGKQHLYPWRFNRSYSYLRRPFLYLDTIDGPELMIGPRHLFQARLYLMRLCYEGRLQAHHPNMQKLISRINNARGESFNDEVADRLQKNDTLVVRRRFKKMGRLRGSRAPPGDIDVLVADRRRCRLLLVECKDLALARTPRELANELTSLFRGHKNRQSSVEKHRKRAQWAEDHLTEILQGLSISPRGHWTVEAVFVFDYKPLSSYVTHSAMPVFSVDEFVKSLL